jgi:hypothetical protein
MVSAMDCFQPAKGKVRVDLGGRDVRVTEEGLHSPQIGSVLYHVGGATVAEHVGTGMASGARRCRPDHLPDSLAREFLCASCYEKER